MQLPAPGTYTLGSAMSRQEGFFAGLTRAFRNNNPGNIAWDGIHGFAAAHGATHGDTGPNTPMAVFPTLTMGMAARNALLSAPAVFQNGVLVHGYLGARVEQVIYRYCPPNAPGNSLALTETYVRNVCTWLGCKRTDIVTLEMLRGPDLLDVHASAHHLDGHTLSTVWNWCAGAAATLINRRFWRDMRYAWRNAQHHARRTHAVLTGKPGA